MVKVSNGKKLYFDPQTIGQYQLLGYTDAHLPVLRLFYKNGTGVEDMIDVYNMIEH